MSNDTGFLADRQGKIIALVFLTLAVLVGILSSGWVIIPA